MDDNEILDQIIKNGNLITKIYDYIRLINPVEKKVYAINTKTDILSSDITQKCFALFGRKSQCENCISMRSLNCHKTIVKIEFLFPRAYIITAVPVDHDGKEYVVELFKDITDEGILNFEGEEIQNIHRIIDKNNSIIVKDALTKVYNEKYFNERLPADIFRVKVEKRTLCLFLISVENFKTIINDFGFSAGESILRNVSKALKYYCKHSSDWVARLSSSEFVIIINDIAESESYNIAKRISAKLKKIRMEKTPVDIKIDYKVGFQFLKEGINSGEFLIAGARTNIINEQLNLNFLDNSGNDDVILDQYLLTLREKEVAMLILEGYSNIEISDKLFIGLSTVKKHIMAIYDKTHVKNRSEFISKYKFLIK